MVSTKIGKRGRDNKIDRQRVKEKERGERRKG